MHVPDEAANGAAVPRALRAAAGRASCQPLPSAPGSGPPRQKRTWRLTSAPGFGQHASPTRISSSISGKSGAWEHISGRSFTAVITSRQRSRCCSGHRTPHFHARRRCGCHRATSRQPGCKFHCNASVSSTASWRRGCFGRATTCRARRGVAAGSCSKSGSASAAGAKWCCCSAQQCRGAERQHAG